MPFRPATPQLLIISFSIHLALILYANHIDSHPERYGGLKYTDVDWAVVTDGAKLIYSAHQGNVAQGWAVKYFGLSIGDPYNRATFRYTPLLPLLLSQARSNPILGKLTLTIFSLLIPPILLSDPKTPFWPTHLLWTLNPFVLNITTRGSPEAIIVLLVISTLACLRRSSSVKTRNHNLKKWEIAAAVVYSLSISYKIYPVIYAPAIWTFLSRRHGWFGRGVWRFGIVTLIGLVGINGVLWSIWGHPFLHHTFLYHLHRQDHRHNFSPYFYPIYLSLFPSLSPSSSTLSPPPSITLLEILRHPLASFVPQFGLVTVVGFLLPKRTSLEFTMFVQTVGFVTFNKVCTSQYFTWFLPLLPSLLPNLHISPTKTALMLATWIGAQAMWLGMAYQLELMGKDVFLGVWVCGIGFFGVGVWVLGEVLDGFG